MNPARCVFAATLLLAHAALAEDKAPAPAKFAIKAQRILDVRAGKYLTHSAVLVEGDTIKAIGAAPEGYPVIDLGPATLMPGLIDAHTHLMADAPPSQYP